MLYTYRITKYNPMYRVNGTYIKDDWIGISDIGQNYDEVQLTYGKYCEIEESYIKAIIKIMEFNNINTLMLKCIGKYKPRKNSISFNDINYNKAIKFIENLSNNMSLDKEAIKLLSKLELREAGVWGELVNVSNMYVSFGYDYYMHIGSGKELTDSIIKDIEENMLFVEEWNIPNNFIEPVKCPVCDKYIFEYKYEVCPICKWEHDYMQEDIAGNDIGANIFPLRESKLIYKINNKEEKRNELNEIVDKYRKKIKALHNINESNYEKKLKMLRSLYIELKMLSKK